MPPVTATVEGPFPWNNAEPVASPAPGPYDGTDTTAIPGAAQTYQEAGPFLAIPIAGVISITPNTGPATGGTPVTVVLTDTALVSSILVGGIALTGFAVVDHVTVTGTTATGMAIGANDVQAVNPAGTTPAGNGLFTGS